MAERSCTFPATHRLGGRIAFAAVFERGVKDSRGPLTLFAFPNDLHHPRLGLSVSRRVGNAVRRNRIKRLLREAFRFIQHDLPQDYDLVVVVRPHNPFTLDEYQKLLLPMTLKLHSKWQQRRK